MDAATEEIENQPDFRVAWVRGRFVAICSCSWKSPSLPTAGLAETAWDGHVAAEH